MAFNFVAGDSAGLAWQPVGVAFSSLLNVKEASQDLMALLLDVTGTLAGGIRHRIAGPIDGASEVTASIDMDGPPYATPILLGPGLRGLLLYFVSAPLNKAFQIPSIVEKVHYQYSIETEVRYSFSLKVSGLVGALLNPSFP